MTKKGPELRPRESREFINKRWQMAMQEGPKGRQNNGAEMKEEEEDSGEKGGEGRRGAEAWDAEAALKHADVTYLGQIV